MSNLEGLNWVSPLSSADPTPVNGPNDPNRTQWDLSAPVDAHGVDAALTAWTSVAFDFESFVGGPPPSFDRAFDHRGSLEAPQELMSPFGSAGLESIPVSTLGNSLTINPGTLLPGELAPVPSADSPTTAVASPSTGKPARRSGHSQAHTTGVGTDGLTQEQIDEEANRRAIEEDKRRRNTAASARFRVKKKQREQALEQSAKEMRERVVTLEKEVEQLKSENGWLRGLVLERGGSIAREDNATPTQAPVEGKRKRGERSTA